MKLHDIDSQLERLLDGAVDPETGEVRDEHLFAQLNGLKMRRENLALDLACYAKDREAEADALKTEKAKLQKRETVARKRFENTRAYLANFIQAGEKLSDARAAISWHRSKAVILSAAPEDLDPRFQRKKIEADKDEIRRALLGGEEVVGAVLEERHNIQLG